MWSLHILFQRISLPCAVKEIISYLEEKCILIFKETIFNIKHIITHFRKPLFLTKYLMHKSSYQIIRQKQQYQMDVRFENCEHIFDISPLIQINPFEKHLLNSNIKFEQFSISAVPLYERIMVKDLPLPLSRRFILKSRLY